MKYARMNNYVEVHNQCALNKYTKHRVNMLGLDNFITSEIYLNFDNIVSITNFPFNFKFLTM